MDVRTAVIAITLLGPLLAGCADANVYDMSPDQVYAKLIELRHGTPSVIKVEGVREGIYGTPGKSVTWVTDYAHSYHECTAYLTPKGSARTSVNVGCSDKNAPAKFGIAKVMVDQIAGEAKAQLSVAGSFKGVRNRYIELVDSTLDGRSFDDVRARSQVMGWPDPPI
ncbi:hypothetical protein [Sphingomonas sp.]|uniref:hypothetical protein n=1 Tax=Sphingomonas sp. TaxID=28214 RepID=UPI003D6CD8B1